MQTATTTQADRDNRILDCGHKPSEHGEHTTGTAHFTNKDGTKTEICCACADERQRADLLTNDKYCAYVSSNGKELNTWTGGKLGTITAESQVRSWRNSSFGDLFAYSITDVHGQRWYGRGSGRGMLLTIRKCK